MINIAANEQHQFEALCRVLGQDALAGDPRFAGREARKENRAALTASIEEALAGRTARQWVGLLVAEGVPAGEILTVPEILAHGQIAERGLLRTFPDVPGVGRPVTVLNSGARPASQATGVTSPPPRLGEHTVEVLAALGVDEDQISILRDQEII